MKIINFELSEIKPYFRNPRRNAKTVNALVKSIERYGMNVPLAVDRDLVLVAGHARYLALVRMGWDKPVPCIQLKLNQEKIRMYRIRDNQIHDFTEWDVDSLMTEITGIKSFGEAIEFFDGVMDDVLVDLSDVVELKSTDFEFKPANIGDYDVLDDDDIVDGAGQENTVGVEGSASVEKVTETVEEPKEVVMCPYCGEDNNV